MNRVSLALQMAAKGARRVIMPPIHFASLNLSPRTRFSLPRYFDMTASDERKYVFFQVAKVATSSVVPVLACETNVSVNQGHALYHPTLFEGYFKFSLVRNPWDRLVSCYFDKIRGRKMFSNQHGKEFPEFVTWVSSRNLKTVDRHLRLQSCLMPVDDMDFVGRFESLGRDLQTIFERVGIQGFELPHYNRSKHKHYSDYYDDHTKSLVERAYAEDIERFEYRFEKPA